MPDILIRQYGKAGHITLNRPQALNALTWEMCLEIEKALDGWRNDPDIVLIMIDGAGERAFCSGGDIAEMYAAGQRGDLDYGRNFWRDEYRLNAKIHAYPKPVVTFLHGFTMGGGVGVGCHGSHRIVCENSQIAMPECSIGLVPDVGGSLILAKAPGHCGEYLGLTGDRMDAGDAIYAGFADHYVPQEEWEALKVRLAETGAADIPSHPAPDSRLAGWQTDIDAYFKDEADSEAAQRANKLMARNAPLAMATCRRILVAVRENPDIKTALDREFRYTYRCVAQGDFIEGIRAAIIDRDKQAKWQPVTDEQVTAMTASLGENALQWEDDT
ncbi:enoyl-CoA hydratase/isomerase family protein [Cognatiyoonia sp. IB215446]|uniref:enoyl-CoA hydratase/isomerase family protein n=1 Tax=Cognatiyoonia sp. IB215446 TaxID=3097355 RepID=UPI002A12AE05|nr:enoyl-CoA hydratase/isomerase family protein [Cognatiyoonia sp. IB215446]MDX8348701.1 enoyl-CoA hydratase/isomerase family protein [Cognatiyoonia sp. IB215446]